MCGSEGAPASAGGGGDGDREGRMGEEDGDESMCRQRGSTGRMKWSQGGELSWAPALWLNSGKMGTPVVHRGSKAWRGSDSAGNRRAETVEEERLTRA